MGQQEGTEVLRSSLSSASGVKPGDTLFVRIPGRAGQPVIVRVLIESVEDTTLEVELYPEFQLPVRFMKTITVSDIVSM
jgi:hypothetical protein